MPPAMLSQLPERIAAQVLAHDLFRALDAEARASVLADLSLARLPAGAQLFRQGEPGDSMYLIIAGRLRVSIAYADGREVAVDELTPGMTVGELALLTGHPRTASVIAAEDAELLRVDRARFERLCALAPSAARAFAESLVPRMLRVDLAGAMAGLFGDLSVAELHRLQARMEWLHLPAGAALFRQGDPPDGLYIVVTGRLRTVLEGHAGPQVIGEVGRGECVGEVALLTGEPRSATVYAARDAYLVKLSQAQFDELVQSSPQLMAQIARIVIRRARPAHRTAPSAAASVFAIIPAGAGAPIAELTRQLAEALSALGPTLHLSSGRCDELFGRPGAAQIDEDQPQNIALVSWLNEQASRRRYVVYEADAAWSPWTRRCMRQADRLIIVGQAGGDPAPGQVEAAVIRHAPETPAELALVHPAGTRWPSGTQAWLAQRRAQAHHHVRLGVAEDIERLARRLTGRAIGLVMSGGGARGLAHIGAIRAIVEAGLRPDFVGGTSAGSMAAASYARGLSYEDMLALARTSSSRKKMLDYTLPVTSLIETRRFTRFLRAMLGEIAIEDLWLRYFAISSNLTRAEPAIHTSGPLWRAVRASSAIPVVFAPLQDGGGDVLVDGGVMNNFPIDVMRDTRGVGVVIGVDVMPPADEPRAYAFGPSVSGWRLLWERVARRGRPPSAPPIMEVLMRTIEINGAYRLRSPGFRERADLLITVPLRGYGTFSFDAYPQLIDLGYQAAKEQLAGWRRPWQQG